LPIFVLFVDLSSAFDHVIRKWLFKSIYIRFPSNANITCIKILENTTTAFADTPDDKFIISSGVRQGGPESPFLYNLLMDFVMRVFIQECKKENVKYVV
jgi:hypothetical protein